ncbi:MAG TPA: YbdK family carboxylate-amine ligase [Solirubrobacteraceae bacterium]|nr:YbdK family carboxylate-amine ligase [Solirubrobacteraceae bacterium]
MALRGNTVDRPAFGEGPVFKVGAEEELLLVNAMSGDLSGSGPETLERGDWSAGQALPEICQSVIEFVTPVCAHAAEAAEVLSNLRWQAHQAGSTVLGSGVHPNGRLGDVPLTRGARYDAVAASLRGLLRRTPHCGLHVHVGMPDAETGVRALNGMRKWLPMLVALGANSPFWHGCDSGLSSARSVIARSLPRSGPPPVFRDYDDYRATVNALVAAGELIDFREIWWDARLQPALGTLEVRALDAQSSLLDIAGLVALVHCLAVHEAQQARCDPGPTHEILEETIFRAFRDGRCGPALLRGRATAIARDLRRGSQAGRRARARSELRV